MNITDGLIKATIETLSAKKLNDRRCIIVNRVKKHEVELCCEWLSEQKKLKEYGLISSYELKHVVEKWIEIAKGKHHYISQQSFIVAAEIMSFEPKFVDYYMNGHAVIKISGSVYNL